MKDIVITGKMVRREILVFVGCLVFAECLNVYAILKYSRPASELVMMLGFVVVTAIIVYVLLAILRLVIALIVKIFRKARQ